MLSRPVILSFDTSAAHCAAALLCGQEILASHEEAMQKGQAEALMPMIETILDAGQVDLDDLDAIAVGIGPGNFTGVRIAVSAARGLALALDLPAIGVSRLEALGFGTKGHCQARIDARRGAFYVQDFSDGQALSDPALTTQPPVGLQIIGQPPEIQGATPPVFPIAQAIAMIAAARIGQDHPRPAPLYIRQPDAALPSEPAPKILT